MVKSTCSNGNIVFEKGHGAGVVNHHNVCPNVCGAGALRPNPGCLLFVGAKLHTGCARLKNPDEVTSRVGGMHKWNANDRTCIAVVPKRYRKGGCRVKSKTWGVADQELATAIKIVSGISSAKTIGGKHSTGVGEVVIEHTGVVAVAVKRVVTL